MIILSFLTIKDQFTFIPTIVAAMDDEYFELAFLFFVWGASIKFRR